MCFALKKKCYLKYKHLVVHYCYLFSKKWLDHVDTYGVLLLVDSMKSIEECVSVVKLRVFVKVVIRSLVWVRMKAMSYHAGGMVILIY